MNINLATGWSVVQDVHDLGEKLGIYRRDWSPDTVGPCISPWEPIDRLAHLQLLLARQPYFGRELRHFNAAPWWYRVEFPTPDGADMATLRFEGVDYFCKIYLNDQCLGEHEGYTNAFEFEVGPLLAKDKPNVLVVKVRSPWDSTIVPGQEKSRFWYIVRNLIKGSYEHADTFVQRDVNPVGIWRPVRLITHQGVRPLESPCIVATPSEDMKQATVSTSWRVASETAVAGAQLRVRILSLPEHADVATITTAATLSAGENTLTLSLDLNNPRLWNTWDRGGPSLYEAQLELVAGDQVLLQSTQTFGVRKVEMVRTKDEITFLLNGRPLYLRGATYWSDLYVSNTHRGRYQRDIDNAIRLGINSLRIHVHMENDDFYELCDRLGVLVFQDSDVTWAFPTDDRYARRAASIFCDTIRHLRNHPSIACWICMNEATGDYQTDGKTATIRACERPGAHIAAEVQRLDPTRPIIRNSGARDDLSSGDGHDYTGSLNGGEFAAIYGTREKLATEFGVDAPPLPAQARHVPEIAQALSDVLPEVARLHDYQYHLLKYYMEHYRMQKYAPCGGYFQFMWIDFCPQSFYGVYDYWGQPKNAGLGGGTQAMAEANMPVGIFMEYSKGPVALHAVNDLLTDYGRCTAAWTITTSGAILAQGRTELSLGPDAHVRICDLRFTPPADAPCSVSLTLTDASGRAIASNIYHDPFHPPKLPPGHPSRINHELGMRLWWARNACDAKAALDNAGKQAFEGYVQKP